MSGYLHTTVDIEVDELVEVQLEGQEANVMLLDTANYHSYRAARPFRYFGGHATHSPVHLRPPRPGHWHVVVDLGGAPGRVRASVRVISE